MALKILAEQVHYANVDLNHNQLNNARIQNLSAEPTSNNAAGRIFYDTDTNQIKVYNGSAFVQLVTETTDSNDITDVESILNTSLVVGRDAHNQIKFSTDDQIIFRVGNADGVTFKASGEIEATSLDISGDVDIDGTLETDALSIASTTVSSTAAELNLVDGSSAGTIVNSKAVIYGSSGEVNATTLQIGGTSITATAAELNVNDGVTAGTVAASKVVVVDSNKDIASFRNVTLTGELDAATLDISGDADIDGTLEADAITVNGTALNTVIAGVTVDDATNAAHVLITDNESTDEDNQITFIEGAGGGGANRGLEADGDFTYNPSTGTVKATIFKGNIDAVDGDFDGTLEADAITIGGENLLTAGLITTLGTISQDTVIFTSANADDPVIQIKNTTNSAGSQARMEFIKDKGAAGAQLDDVGSIKFIADNDAQELTDFAELFVEIAGSGGAADTDEAGIMQLKVATSDGTTSGLRAGLSLEGSTSAQTVDVTLGSGTASTVTIAGNLTVSGTTTTVNSTTVNLNDHNIVLDSGNSTSAVINGAGITIEGGSGDDATFTYSTTGPQFEMKLGSSYEDLQVAKLTASSLDISGDVDVDGTLETDALTIDGTNLLTGAVTFSGNTVFSGTPNVSGTLTVAGDIQHTGDTNNKIAFGTDTQSFETGGTARMNISDSGLQIGTGSRVTTILDEDDLSTDSATALATQQSIKAYVDASAGMTGWVLEDGDGTEVNVTNAKEVKFVEGGNIDINWTDTDNGTDGDPYDLTFTVPSASTSTAGAVELATTAEALAGSDSSRAVTPEGLAARSYSESIGDGSATAIAVDHNLNTRDVIVQLYDVSSYDTVIADVVRTTVDRVTITFASAPASNDIRVLVTKID
jgi:cytoskeletal protein CcmA (bactofilin family)